MQPWADAILQAGNPPGIWDTKVGGRKEGHRTLVSVQACSHYPSPFQDSGERSRSGPPTFTGADSSVCAVCTHLPPLVPQLKSISFMVREGSLPLWPSPAPLFSWVCAGTTGEIWGLCSPFICVCHFPQVLHQGLVGGYRFTCWVPACHTQSPAFLLPVASAWAGVPAGPKDRSQAGLCKYLAILGREVDWKKGGWKWEESKSLIWLSKRSEVILL